MELREHAKKHVDVVQAKERVELRRWLRKNAPRDEDGNMPSHLYLAFNRDELVELVDQYGGDAEDIINRARNAVIDKIMGRRS